MEIPSVLSDELKQLWNKDKSRYVFCNAQGDQLSRDTLIGSFKSLIKGTKFEGIGFHCFRHSLASNLAAKGIKPYVIDEILWHQTQEMRERYRHLFPEQKAEAIASLKYGR
ncbi:MAG: tyrosine-type recombinase/integrase [Candidatus Brocadiae bacterium]|nr:tyrosine-type recombinase/integrase [Candidatus Brocadiia bacterium]